MEPIEQNLTFAQFGALVKLTKDVIKKTKLSYVHIIPAEAVGHDLWGETKKGDVKAGKFNARLGVAASSIINRELQAMFALKSAEEREEEDEFKITTKNEPFRIGVAGGQVTYFAVSGMPMLKAGSFEVEIAPLVIGSVPQHRYSAGTIAEMMAAKITYQDTDAASITALPARPFASVAKIEKWIEEPGSSYKVEIKQDIRDQRDSLSVSVAGFFDLDYVLVGIGQYDPMDKTTNLFAHIETLYKGKAPAGLMGDICSRLFDKNGGELERQRQDNFVAISFRALELLVDRKKTPVIAIAGGLSKVEAIKTIAARQPLPVINGLITDELTAMQLLK